MAKRFLTIWFPHLLTDWFSIRKPALYQMPFVLAAPDHGRLVITAVNELAGKAFICPGMVVADARAILPSLIVQDEEPGHALRLLRQIAAFCIRWTPLAGADEPDGITLEITGCSHLWGDEMAYLTTIVSRLSTAGYQVRAAIADTIGSAWAMARFGTGNPIIPPGRQQEAMTCMPPQALRLEGDNLERMEKLGLHRIGSIINMPRSALRRRFGPQLLQRIDQASGEEDEAFEPVFPLEPYQERLPCLEPIVTAPGISIALQRLLDVLCLRLQREQQGLREAVFKGFRLDGKVEEVRIGTHRGSHNADHLNKLFEPKLAAIEPALGIELFILEAPKIEELHPLQRTLWQGACGLEDTRLSELIDRLVNRTGENCVHRYLPDAHHWPERSVKASASLLEKPAIPWNFQKPRPLQLLREPEPIEVTAPVPDYPPMLFRYKGMLHKIKKADGPERIEREWWLEEGQHRDYYCVENEAGARYWLFRSGHYSVDKNYQWFIHGFFS